MSVELVEKVEMAAGHCPVRGCEGDLDYGCFELEDDGGYYPWRCMSCGATGKEWHDMSFSEHMLTGEPTPATDKDKLERLLHIARAAEGALASYADRDDQTKAQGAKAILRVLNKTIKEVSR